MEILPDPLKMLQHIPHLELYDGRHIGILDRDHHLTDFSNHSCMYIYKYSKIHEVLNNEFTIPVSFINDLYSTFKILVSPIECDTSIIK